jgi:hypothetical protein
MTTTHTAMGYRATRAEDGTLTIHRVPIFVECERGDVQFNAEWIATAVKNAKAQQREGYLPPLHIRHHEPATDANNAVRAAGFFKILGAEAITFKGARRTAILADLIITCPITQEEVLAKRLPYRSVEIFNVDRPAINGLALLDHEAPFLELPMLLVAEVDDQQREPGTDYVVAAGVRYEGGREAVGVPGGTFKRGWSMDGRVNDEPMVACFRRGHTAHLLMQDEENLMPKTAEQIAAEEAEAAKRAQFADDDKGGDGDKGDKGDKSEDMEGGEGGLDVKAIVKAIADGSISVADMDAIIEAIQAQKGGSEEPEGDPAANTPAPAAAPGAEAMKDTNDNAANFARLTGENEALKARLDARDEADATKADVDGAMERLSGKPLGADLRERLVNFRKDHGADAFKSYVDGLAGAVGTHPTKDGAESFSGQAGAVPEVAMKYQDKGTDAVDRAANFAREWRSLNDAGHTRMSEERYVEINMERSA